MLEKLLFKKIELWVLLLLLIFGLIGTVLFSFTVWYGTKGAARYKGLTDTTIAIARSPMTIAKVIDRTILNTSDSELAQRFGDQAGLTFNTAPDPNAGYILVNRHDGDIKASVTELVDLASQEIVQRWVFDVDPIWRQTDFVSRLFDFRLDSRTSRFRAHSFILKDGSLVVHGSASPLFKLNVCGDLKWIQDQYLFHHSTELDADGNIWVPIHIEPKSVNIGIDDTFYDDGIAKVTPDGKILYTKSVVQILDDNDLDYLVFGLGQETYNDPIHLNDIQPVLHDGPYWQKGDVFLSIRNQALVLLYRPSENKVMWHQVGPWMSQHDVDIIDDKRIGVFNNNSRRVGNDARVDGSNDEVVYNFETGQFETPFRAGFQKLKVRTFSSGSGDFVGDDEIFVEETDHGRLVQFDRDGNVNWQYINRAQDGKLYLFNWSKSVSRDVGDSIRTVLKETTCEP